MKPARVSSAPTIESSLAPACMASPKVCDWPAAVMLVPLAFTVVSFRRRVTALAETATSSPRLALSAPLASSTRPAAETDKPKLAFETPTAMLPAATWAEAFLATTRMVLALVSFSNAKLPPMLRPEPKLADKPATPTACKLLDAATSSNV